MRPIHLFFGAILLLPILPDGSQAGESGFVFQGQTYIVYKDGQKVGKTFQELFGASKKVRGPSAAIPDSTTYYLSYEADGTTKCYRWSDLSAKTLDIFCVK